MCTASIITLSGYYWILLDINSKMVYNAYRNTVKQIKIFKPTIKPHICMYKRVRNATYLKAQICTDSHRDMNFARP